MAVYEEQIDGTLLRAKTDLDLEWLTYPVDGLLPMVLIQKDDHLTAQYEIDHKHPFKEIYTWPYERQLKVLIDISRLCFLTQRYAFSLEPENIMIDAIERSYIIRRDILPAGSCGEARFLAEYKALALSVLNHQYTFRDYMADFTGHLSAKHPVMSSIMKCRTDEEISNCLLEERRHYLTQKQKDYVHLQRKQYKWQKLYLYISACLLILLVLVSSYLGFKKVPDLHAGKSLGEYYLMKDYEKCIEVMKGQSVSQMAPVQSYMLANAYVRMEELSDEQRENILNTLHLKDSDLRSKYWIFIGRNQTEQALDTAGRLADPELELYSYLLMAKNISEDQNLSGQEKHDQSESVQSEIERIQRELEFLDDE